MSAARLLRLVGRRLELPLALGLGRQLLGLRVDNAAPVPPPLAVLA